MTKNRTCNSAKFSQIRRKRRFLFLVKKSISVYLDKDIIRALEERAEEQGMSVSALCRVIITRDVRGQPRPEPELAKACPNCGKTEGERDEDGQQIFYLFPNGMWRCTNCGGEGIWKN